MKAGFYPIAEYHFTKYPDVWRELKANNFFCLNDYELKMEELFLVFPQYFWITFL